MSALSCTGLGVELGGRTIFAGLDLKLSPGQVTAIVGPNGAGKSTLLSCLAGLRAPSRGAVLMEDTPLVRLKPATRARRLAFLPQIPEIAWPIEAGTLVALGRTPFLGARGPARSDAEAVDRAMAAAGVSALQHRVVTTLSGGERSRVLIARALAGEPEWLLADEPLTGLDPAHQMDAAALFRRLAAGGTGIVLTLHDLTMALRVADRALVLGEAQILADGAPAAALTPDVLRRAYGVEAVLSAGPGGPLIDIVGRCAP